MMQAMYFAAGTLFATGIIQDGRIVIPGFILLVIAFVFEMIERNGGFK